MQVSELRPQLITRLNLLKPHKSKRRRVTAIPFLEPSQQNQSRPAHDPTITEENLITHHSTYVDIIWFCSPTPISSILG
jgi:hypothetical protein